MYFVPIQEIGATINNTHALLFLWLDRVAICPPHFVATSSSTQNPVSSASSRQSKQKSHNFPRDQ